MIMNEKLQEAISAARSGQKTEAQQLLAEVLKDDPNETQAWFLLSNLVDSKQKKAAYLSKVLALEPDHEMAQTMLGRLQEEAEPVSGAETVVEPEIMLEEAADEAEPAPVVVSANTADFLAQQRGDTLPDWLIEEDGLDFVTEGEAVVSDESSADEAVSEEEAVPDWLQEEVPESWEEVGETVVETAVTPEASLPEKVESAPAPKPKPTTTDDVQRQQKFLNGVLYALVVTAVIIFLILIYLAWNTLL
jgi:cytochrome c-type biogenesis protein CcmH/NrfG